MVVVIDSMSMPIEKRSKKEIEMVVVVVVGVVGVVVVGGGVVVSSFASKPSLAGQALVQSNAWLARLWFKARAGQALL